MEQQTNTEQESTLIEIVKNIDWQRFHNLCTSINKDLNEPQWRFLKATLLESAVGIYSNHELTYVGDTERGCDFLVKKMNNLRVEMKYIESGLFGGKKLSLKKTTTEIKLMNSNGTNTHSCLPDSYADYLLIVDLHGAGLISKDNLKKYTVSGGDGIKSKIPTDMIQIVFQPSDIKETNKQELNIKETFMNTIHTIINSVHSNKGSL